MGARFHHVLLRLALMSTFVVTAPCTDLYDLCPPLESDVRRPFFSRGDCTISRANMFAGHEWLTLFAHDALPPEVQLPGEEADLIIDGVRRVDWPRELLVHLNVGLHAYVAAILEYTKDPALQRDHFLLANDDTHEEAAAKAHARLRELTHDAVLGWARDRPRSLTQIGAALHMIQDSYSEAHTVRDFEVGCVVRLKAFIERDEGYLTDDIEFHGQSDDMVGHSSPDDSIFNGELECRTPDGAAEVRACLRNTAEVAVATSTEYLALVFDIADGAGWDANAEARLEVFIGRHLSICPD